MAAHTTTVIECCSTRDMAEERLRAVCALWSEAFPTASGRDRYAEADARRRSVDSDQASAEMVHCVFEAGHCVAAARTFVARKNRPGEKFVRRVVKVGGAAVRVLALAHVATSPAARGRRLGVAVVRKAWDDRLGGDVPCCLFCTGVPDFYAKMGATAYAPRAITYPKGAKPFHDTAVMLFGAPDARFDPKHLLDVGGDGW